MFDNRNIRHKLGVLLTDLRHKNKRTSIKDVLYKMVGVAGWRQENNPVNCFLPTGESLLT